MAKQYRIDLVVNASQAEAAMGKASGSARAAHTAFDQCAKGAKQSFDQIAKDKKLNVDQLAELESKWLAREYKERSDFVAKTDKLAQQELDKAKKKTDDLASIEAKWLAREYADRMAYASKKDKLDDKEVSDTKKKTDDLAAIESKWLAREYSERVSFQAKKDKLAQKSTDDAKRDKDELASIEQKWLEREYNDRVRYEAKKQKAAEKTAAAAQKRADREVEREAKKHRSLLTDQEIALKVQNQKIANANDEKIKHAMKAADVEYKGNKNGWEGANMLAAAVRGVAGSYLSLQFAAQLLKDIGDAAKEAAEHQDRLTDAVIAQRDAMRELQAMKGMPADTHAVLSLAKFSSDTGMSMDEARQFQADLMGSGEQHKGKNISDAQFEAYQKKVAQLTVAKGIDPASTATLAGLQLGFKDYSKFGDKAADMALADLNKALSVLIRGNGLSPELVPQLAKLAAASVSENDLAGTFPNSEDAGIAISMFAEANPGRSADMSQAAIRGLRGFKKEQGPLLKKAGIDPQTGFLDAIQKLAPIVKAEAERTKTKIYDVLMANGFDQEESKALQVALDKGVGNKPGSGVIADRRATAKANGTPEAAQKVIDDARNDPNGAVIYRLVKQKKEEENAKIGAINVQVAALKMEAESRLIKRREIDTADTNAGDLWHNRLNPKAWFGLEEGSRNQRLHSEEFRMLLQRGKAHGITEGEVREAAGLPREKMRGGASLFDANTTVARDKQVRGVLELFRAKGINPLNGERMPQAANDPQIPALLKQIADNTKPKPAAPAIPAVPNVLPAPRAPVPGVAMRP